MLRIAEGLYALEACGSVNAFLIEGSADLTLVDTGHSRGAENLLAEFKANGFATKDIGRVVLTHAHADHVGGLAAILKEHPVKVYAHPKEIPVLLGRRPPAPFRGFAGFLRGVYERRAWPWEPLDTVFPAEPGTTLRGIPQWQLLHTPGHTDGGLSLFHPVRQILLCGDALDNATGALKLPDPRFSADPGSARKSAEELSRLDCDLLCCGHGKPLRGGAFRYIEALLSRGRV